jgi:hypothetical protein
MKICPRCKESEIVYKSGYCKPCNDARSKEWYSKNKNVKKKAARKHYYKKKYSIDIDIIPLLLEEQGNMCKICKTSIHLKGTLDASQAVIDHCHTTGVVRGLLCNLCNMGLGSFKDNPDLLEEAKKYLKENKN